MWGWPEGLASPVLAAAALLALLIDWAMGEPPPRWHPVVWMGRYLQWSGQRVAPRAGATYPQRRTALAGAVAWWAGAGVVLLISTAVQAWIASLPLPLQALLLGLLLKPTLAWRMLRDEVWAVEAAQAQSLVAARRRVARLVSRDVRHATGPQVRQAALSTLAENLNDSVLSPLLWWAIAGLPGAALYRYANTADAMWGYRGVRNGRDWTWAGRWAARADDVLSWPGARLSAALLLAAAPAWRAVRLLPAEVRRTPSPNSGWPMAALALALDLVLAKPGVYVIHARGRLPAPQDTARALSLCARVVALCALACAGLLLAAWGRGLG